ncbi:MULTISPECIES: hypothetical protein [Myxococcus]|uniref:hypothetical protein n=1 Tax=Myxococcus TaxID=32 RepID=UPI001143B58D|nr:MULTISPECIES: hypothetical protein [Myxococcus]NOK05790.1 hypothetical protein [Myxococcus xanthus]
MSYATRGIKRTPKVTPELERHRAVRAEFLRELAELQGTAPEPTPPQVIPPEERCHCGSKWLDVGNRRICGLGLHDG